MDAMHLKLIRVEIFLSDYMTFFQITVHAANSNLMPEMESTN